MRLKTCAYGMIFLQVSSSPSNCFGERIVSEGQMVHPGGTVGNYPRHPGRHQDNKLEQCRWLLKGDTGTMAKERPAPHMANTEPSPGISSNPWQLTWKPGITSNFRLMDRIQCSSYLIYIIPYIKFSTIILHVIHTLHSLTHAVTQHVSEWEQLHGFITVQPISQF